MGEPDFELSPDLKENHREAEILREIQRSPAPPLASICELSSPVHFHFVYSSPERDSAKKAQTVGVRDGGLLRLDRVVACDLTGSRQRQLMYPERHKLESESRSPLPTSFFSSLCNLIAYQVPRSNSLWPIAFFVAVTEMKTFRLNITVEW